MNNPPTTAHLSFTMVVLHFPVSDSYQKASFTSFNHFSTGTKCKGGKISLESRTIDFRYLKVSWQKSQLETFPLRLKLISPPTKLKLGTDMLNL